MSKIDVLFVETNNSKEAYQALADTYAALGLIPNG